ncbi:MULTISPECIES: hypothetical protein [unclassified Pseudomonas]|uniref:hypothetical protein n=1 Tax=unclassified Pseudomonas TaxID=196821 RepID=UPI002B22997D|nr:MULTISPECIES: hypothetical protein [unclassified Pseudomonas]MEA9979952.1 hypothetical protein [Pseudomonas sp. RTS4]MEB0198210.1 hypothetical protein [Pseudomonas sp. 5S4]MEB0247801.1 hypothetical protein [Pseudomonas sp. 10S5]
MLTVRYLHPDPTVTDWLHENARLLAGLTLWSLAMLWLAGAGPHIVKVGWYNLNSVEGTLVLTQMLSEDTCRANVKGDALACVSGTELAGGDLE